jgi:protein TonB
MSPEPEKVSRGSREEGLGSLSGCLVDGDAEQRTRERRIRRRALAISVLFESAVLAALILMPVLGKGEPITPKIFTPIPPYSHYRDRPQNPGAPRPHPHGPQNVCRFCAPPSIPHTIATHDDNSSARPTDEALPPGMEGNLPGGTGGLIPLSDSRALPPPAAERRVTRPPVVRVANIDPALLIHRVEPVYPVLARQTRREGRVELRAIIGTDGTIQSLQIVSSDPLFDLSAREAVSQWRYKPTTLNGQPVEIDTFITVIYTQQH